MDTNTDFENVKKQVQEMEERMKLYEEQLAKRKECYSKTPEYHKEYYRNVEKHKQRPDKFCEVCQRDIPYNAYNAHVKTKKHLNKIN